MTNGLRWADRTVRRAAETRGYRDGSVFCGVCVSFSSISSPSLPSSSPVLPATRKEKTLPQSLVESCVSCMTFGFCFGGSRRPCRPAMGALRMCTCTASNRIQDGIKSKVNPFMLSLSSRVWPTFRLLPVFKMSAGHPNPNTRAAMPSFHIPEAGSSMSALQKPSLWQHCRRHKACGILSVILLICIMPVVKGYSGEEKSLSFLLGPPPKAAPERQDEIVQTGKVEAGVSTDEKVDLMIYWQCDNEQKSSRTNLSDRFGGTKLEQTTCPTTETQAPPVPAVVSIDDSGYYPNTLVKDGETEGVFRPFFSGTPSEPPLKARSSKRTAVGIGAGSGASGILAATALAAMRMMRRNGPGREDFSGDVSDGTPSPSPGITSAGLITAVDWEEPTDSQKPVHLPKAIRLYRRRRPKRRPERWKASKIAAGVAGTLTLIAVLAGIGALTSHLVKRSREKRRRGLLTHLTTFHNSQRCVFGIHVLRARLFKRIFSQVIPGSVQVTSTPGSRMFTLEYQEKPHALLHPRRRWKRKGLYRRESFSLGSSHCYVKRRVASGSSSVMEVVNPAEKGGSVDQVIITFDVNPGWVIVQSQEEMISILSRSGLSEDLRFLVEVIINPSNLFPATDRSAATPSEVVSKAIHSRDTKEDTASGDAGAALESEETASDRTLSALRYVESRLKEKGSDLTWLDDLSVGPGEAETVGNAERGKCSEGRCLAAVLESGMSDESCSVVFITSEFARSPIAVMHEGLGDSDSSRVSVVENLSYLKGKGLMSEPSRGADEKSFASDQEPEDSQKEAYVTFLSSQKLHDSCLVGDVQDGSFSTIHADLSSAQISDWFSSRVEAIQRGESSGGGDISPAIQKFLPLVKSLSRTKAPLRFSLVAASFRRQSVPRDSVVFLKKESSMVTDVVERRSKYLEDVRAFERRRKGKD